MFNMGLYICKKNFQLVFKQNYSSQLKTNYIYVFIFYIIVSYGYGPYQGPYIITLILMDSIA
jgi:hypothetical protein